MEFAKARLPITVNGKSCELAFDYAAQLSLEKDFKISRDRLRELLNSKLDRVAVLELLGQLVYSMSRSSDFPPTQKDIQRMSADEILGIQAAILGQIAVAQDGGLGKGRAKAGRSAAAVAANGAGIKRSNKRSRSAASRRRSSGR